MDLIIFLARYVQVPEIPVILLVGTVLSAIPQGVVQVWGDRGLRFRSERRISRFWATHQVVLGPHFGRPAPRLP